jgi:hypothetical protein
MHDFQENILSQRPLAQGGLAVMEQFAQLVAIEQDVVVTFLEVL